jgi:hypothetical protein
VANFPMFGSAVAKRHFITERKNCRQISETVRSFRLLLKIWRLKYGKVSKHTLILVCMYILTFIPHVDADVSEHRSEGLIFWHKTENVIEICKNSVLRSSVIYFHLQITLGPQKQTGHRWTVPARMCRWCVFSYSYFWFWNLEGSDQP